MAFGGSFFTGAGSSLPRGAVWAVTLFLLCFSRPAESDVRGSRDHPLFKRPAGYQIVSYFQGDRSAVLPLESGRTIPLLGQQTDILYRTNGAPLSASALGYRFLTSLRSAGGEVLFQENPALGGRRAVGKFTRPGRDVWVMLEVLSLREYRLTVVEESGKRPSLPAYPVPADTLNRLDTEAQALDLLYSLERAGKLEFPLTFSPGSSVPQKGYEKNFEKFALLMEKDPSLNFRVETYTDPALKPAEQRALLRERVAAIVGLLADIGADRRRLTTEAAPTEAVPSEGAAPQSDPPRGAVRLTLIEPAR